MTALRVAMRADASAALGSGHVMRCLTLADVLRARGAQVLFLSRALPGHLGQRIQAAGFGLQLLPSDGPWDAAADARHSLAALGDLGCDWLVVDHYALAAEWQQALRPACRRLLVIDDLADRAHACDLLLDQNLGRQTRDYDGLLPATASRLIGPAHALLRPAFAAARGASLARRAGGDLQHVLVSMGGADPQQATLRVLQALASCPLSPDAQLTVVLGAIADQSADTRPAIEALLPSLPWPSRLLVDVAHMPALLQAADLAIGAAGGSAWERCCLGLPSLLLLLAPNQQPGTQALVAAGAAQALGTVADLAHSLPAALQALAAPGALQALSDAAAAVTDGQGADRVVDAVLQAA